MNVRVSFCFMIAVALLLGAVNVRLMQSMPLAGGGSAPSSPPAAAGMPVSGTPVPQVSAAPITPPVPAVAAPTAATTPTSSDKQQHQSFDKIKAEMQTLHKLKHELRSLLQEFDDKLSSMRNSCAEAKKIGFSLLSVDQEKEAREAYDVIQKALTELQTMQTQTQAQFSRGISEKLGAIRVQISSVKALIQTFEAEKKSASLPPASTTMPTAANSTSSIPAVQTAPATTTAPAAPQATTEHAAQSKPRGGVIGTLSTYSAAVINGARSVYHWFASPSPDASNNVSMGATPQAPRQVPPPPATKAAITQETLRLIDQVNQDVKTVDNSRIMLQHEIDSVLDLFEELSQSVMLNALLAPLMSMAASDTPQREPSWKKTVVHIFSRTLDGIIFLCHKVYSLIQTSLSYVFGSTLSSFVRDVKEKISSQNS